MQLCLVGILIQWSVKHRRPHAVTGACCVKLTGNDILLYYWLLFENSGHCRTCVHRHKVVSYVGEHRGAETCHLVAAVSQTILDSNLASVQFNSQDST